MRTTLTVDDDVVRALQEVARESREPFKKVVNDALRAGLAARRQPPAPVRYRITPVSLGGAAGGVDLDKSLRVADALEEQEIARKLETRK